MPGRPGEEGMRARSTCLRVESKKVHVRELGKKGGRIGRAGIWRAEGKHLDRSRYGK